MRILGRAIWFLALVVLCLVTTWAAAALYIDFPATNLSLPAGFAIFHDARERCAVERCDEPESSAARARIAHKSLRSVRDPGSFGFLYFSETAGIDFLVASCVPPSTTMVVPTRLALRHRCGSLVVFGQRGCKRSTRDKKVDTCPVQRAG